MLPPSVNIRSPFSGFTIKEEDPMEDSGRENSSDTKDYKSKSTSSSRDSCTISIIDKETWAPLQDVREVRETRPLTAAMVVDEFLERNMRVEERTELVPSQASNSVSVEVSAVSVRGFTSRRLSCSSNRVRYDVHIRCCLCAVSQPQHNVLLFVLKVLEVKFLSV